MNEFINPITLAIGLLALGPFLAIMISSFVKIAVVFLLLRNALGLQQIPPNLAVNGLALILSLYIMAPVGYAIYDILKAPDVDLQRLENPATQQAFAASIEPVRAFLMKHSAKPEREFFARTKRKLWPPQYAESVTEDHLLILLPAFTMSQLTSAFEIAFLLYLPFLAIDLIVSNILLAMGMMMMSPMTVSLPFKLLLFVLVDGRTRLIHGRVLSYQSS